MLARNFREGMEERRGRDVVSAGPDISQDALGKRRSFAALRLIEAFDGFDGGMQILNHAPRPGSSPDQCDRFVPSELAHVRRFQSHCMAFFDVLIGKLKISWTIRSTTDAS